MPSLQVLLEPEPVLRLVLHVGVEEAAGAAALRLRLVEREVGLLDEIVDALAVDRAEGAADRDADPDLGLVDMIGLGDRGDERSARVSTMRRLCASLMTMANSSPPIRPTWPNGPTSLTSRWETLFSTASPLGWPNVSLTGLKPSRSRNMIAQGASPPERARQGLAEQLAHAAAIGQAREHVHVGEVGEPLLGLADLGDVLADAAEALELAGHVDDRIAGEADPARAAAGLQLHLEIGEGLAGEQGAAERAGAAQRRRQRMADQLVGRAAEQGGHPRRDVDDPILGIDLPQPADAAMLIFLEQQPDRFRLGAGLRDAPSAGRRSSGSAATTLNAPAPATSRKVRPILGSSVPPPR